MEILQYNNDNTTKSFIQHNQDVISYGFVTYDKDTYKISGEYSNELLLFRAKKYWKLVLEDTFLLENVTDYKLQVKKNPKLHIYHLICTFKSACARYAFWRINNDQNPEVKYIIETAHQTQTADNYESLLNNAPNFSTSKNTDIIFEIENKANNTSDILKKIVKKICKNHNENDEE